MWIMRRQPRMLFEPQRLVFIDEPPTNTPMTRLRGRSLCGQRLPAQARLGIGELRSRLRGDRLSVAGLRCFGLTAPWVIDGPINRLAFNRCIGTQPAPTLAKGDVVILDNLAVHNAASPPRVSPARM